VKGTVKFVLDGDAWRYIEGLSYRKGMTRNRVLVAALEVLSRGGWFRSGVFVPNGSQARGWCKHAVHYAKVEGGDWVVNGKRYDSPTGAAAAVGSSASGWDFWEINSPGEDKWWRLYDRRKAFLKKY
jgi:hypothetical protein